MTSDDRVLSGRVITVLGGSGFLGQHLAEELFDKGARLRIASRNPERAFRVKPLGNLGQVQFLRCDVRRPDSLAAVFADTDAVVNLVGSFSGDLDSLQGRGAGRIAAAAARAGAAAFVHVSALGGDAESRVDYARTKAEGEAAVRAAFPTASIVRPSLLFGSDDAFVMRFAGLIRAFPIMPVFGPDAKMQPVFVDDVAQGIARILCDTARHGGKTFELAGPEVITMLELNRRIAEAQGRKRHFLELPDALAGAIARLTGWLPGAPITADQWELLRAGSVASDEAPGFTALAMRPRPLGLFLDRWMVRFRKHGRFGPRASLG